MVSGDYPFIMKALVRDGLPAFTEEEKALVKGSYDFIGINYYTSNYALSLPFNPDATYKTSADYQRTTLTSNDLFIFNNHILNCLILSQSPFLFYCFSKKN